MIKFSDMPEKEAHKLQHYCRKNNIDCSVTDSDFEESLCQVNIMGERSPVISCYDEIVVLAYNSTSFILNKSDFYKMEVL